MSSSTTCRLSGHKWQSTTMIPRRPSNFFKPPLPMNWDQRAVSRFCTLLCILSMYEERLTFCCIRAAKQPPSFKKSSTIAGLCGTSPSGHWHTCNWAGPTRLAGDSAKARGAYKEFPYPLERRRPRHPNPEASQGGVREAAMKFAQTSLLQLRSCAFHKVYWLTIFRRGETGGERSRKLRSLTRSPS